MNARARATHPCQERRPRADPLQQPPLTLDGPFVDPHTLRGKQPIIAFVLSPYLSSIERRSIYRGVMTRADHQPFARIGYL